MHIVYKYLGTLEVRVWVRKKIRQNAHVRAKCVRGNISKCEVRACEVNYIAPNILPTINSKRDLPLGIRNVWSTYLDMCRMLGAMYFTSHARTSHFEIFPRTHFARTCAFCLIFFRTHTRTSKVPKYFLLCLN